ncbi:MAG: sigma-54 dependent transcriptional regulator [Gammaproteobacteria bacterium]|nr:sigma-54 dependent transcriptional regulator [Gammaproteobacteria bacterium]
MAYILIIEDDPVFGELLVMHLEDRGHESRVAGDIGEARELLSQGTPDAVLLDHQLPDGYGLDLLGELGAPNDGPPVIMITGVTDNALAIEAIRHGAYDFIRKPMDDLELETTLGNALRHHRLSRQVSAITSTEDHRVDINEIVGRSSAILEVCKTVGAVAARVAPVLITGETGTGKEVVARAIHHHSGRQGLFLPLNCSVLAEGVLESELFGHERGSFTGALGRREGRFELAAGGTLFLDEVGEMPASLQAKLLRVLQEGTFERVGGGQVLHSDARVIAATHRDLEAMVRDGTFREDLYYRLNVVSVHLPPLRERMADLPILIEHLLYKINARQHTAVRHTAEGTWRLLNDYSWPGNVRELENALTRAAVLARGDTLTPELFSLSDDVAATVVDAGDDQPVPPRLITLDELEHEHVVAVLNHVRWHKGRACEILGISRPALDRKIERYGLA